MTIENTRALEQLFSSGEARGFKKPTLRAAGLKFSLAPATGRNAGSIYITQHIDGTYLGKITNGRVFLVSSTHNGYLPLIENIMALPQAAAVRYGHQTGSCAICGRRLDNKESIELGIGPICAEKLGMGFGTRARTDDDVGMSPASTLSAADAAKLL